MKQINYFTPMPTTCEALKELYRKLAMQHHPDRGGDAEIIKIINNEYETLFSKLKDVHQTVDGEIYTAKSPTAETPEQFINIINELIHFEGITIEIIGTFVWVSGNTKVYKEKLKELKFRWSQNKMAWYLAPEGYKKRSRKQFGMDEIRGMFGSQTVDTEPLGKIGASI